MPERTVHFDMVDTPPKQRINHAHIGEGIIRLHWHKPGEEPSDPQGVILSEGDFRKIMTTNYWKEEEDLEASGEEGTNVTGVEVHLGHVDFRFKKGNRSAREEVSVLALRQVDSRIRRRVRDVRAS